MTEQCSCGCGGHSHEYHKEGTCSCGCGSRMHIREHDAEKSCHCAEKFLCIADEAWKEILKEKIKAKILEKKGDHMDKLAEIVATANGEKWKHIISAKMKCDEFKNSLKDFFTSGCE